MSQPSVFIVILNWNGLADTLDCLRELRSLEYPKRQVVVVDNASAGGEADIIEGRHPEVTVLRNTRNLGFTGGCNVGIRYAIEREADYVWLLNNDAVVTPRSLSILVDTAERAPRVGLVGPVVRFFESSQAIQFAGTFVDPETEEECHLRDLHDEADLGANKWPVLVGTAMLVKRAVVEKVGFLDERYFAYCEDWDYSVRALRAGFDVRVERAATILHKPAGSMGRESPVKEYYIVRNRYLFWRTHLPGQARRGYRRRFVGWALERAQTAHADGKPALLEAVLDGLWDALAGRSGQRPDGLRMPVSVRGLFAHLLLRWRPYLWIMLFRRGLRPAVRETWRRMFTPAAVRR